MERDGSGGREGDAVRKWRNEDVGGLLLGWWQGGCMTIHEEAHMRKGDTTSLIK